MKKILFTILFFIVPLCIYAQFSNLDWAKGISGIGSEEGRILGIDAAGNIYVAGRFTQTIDLDPGVGVYNLSSSGNYDIFVSKYDSQGNFLKGMQIGGVNENFLFCMQVDAVGNVIVAGNFGGAVDFDPSLANNILYDSLGAVFLLKMDSGLNFIWVKQLQIAINSFTTDMSNNIYVTGLFDGIYDFDFDTVNTFYLNSIGTDNIFVLKLNSLGDFIWAKKMDGLGARLSGIVSDHNSNLVLLGSFYSPLDVNLDSILVDTISSQSRNAFITKFDSNGNHIWAVHTSGTYQYQLPFSQETSVLPKFLTVDSDNNIIYAAEFSNYYHQFLDFDPDPNNVFTFTYPPDDGTVISKFNSNGQLVFARRLTGGCSALGCSPRIAFDTSNNIYLLITSLNSINLDPDVSNYSVSPGLTIAKYSKIGDFNSAIHFQANSSCLLSNNNNFYITGYFTGTVDFDPNVGVSNLTALAGSDAFLVKLGLNNTGVGISALSETNWIRIFPNPSDGLFKLELDKKYQNVTLELSDVTGRLIFSKNYNELSHTSLQINEAPGIYYLSVAVDGKKNILKLRKQ